MFSASSATVSSSTGTAHTGRRRHVARLTASVVASGLVMAGALVGAGSATADEVPAHQGGATAVLDGLKTYDTAVLNEDGKQRKVSAGLFEMNVDGGGTLKTYCIDIHNPTQDRAKYLETPWDQTSLGGNNDAGKILWILQHSYPQVNDLSELAKAAGTGALTDKTAAAGTQVAIWRFSDHVQVKAQDEQAEKLADWLEKSATVTAEPKASLALDPVAVSGRSGERVGPVTVHTNAGQATVTPPADLASGVKVTDKDGKPVTTASDGDQLYFDVPAGSEEGSASLTVQAATSVPVGRAFAGVTKSQTQILAGSSESTVSAAATASWAKKGPIPTATAEKNCAKGGVDVTVGNQGDEAFTFELDGKEQTVEAGKTATVTVPVAEDQAYDITVTGPGGFSKTFKGVLDCKTTSSGTGGTGGTDTQTGGDEPTPTTATAGGSTSGGDDTNLAETGSSSATPMIAGIAIALVVVGGGAVVLLRRKGRTVSE
ncbi:Cys-Gln thioester bond-forming surface protein [Streptomyces sp. NBC_00890]|nr:Cys-Gln thioester bond-forming surface protein [Streptomyces sp. NBC_00891]WSY05496.1 Cys-Gln thioester bond-forming surface protein [Streptomyces sp. NBC_00890]WSZ07120.1 Cys-Gln thioester bond-forming surface protein [Streptomyces sp. NBC_00869]WSZ25381.1 Cys-Gln thioester bond-forming surface protein [Streptomyces sp. NBC_00870]